jgi:hypothetical protein
MYEHDSSAISFFDSRLQYVTSRHSFLLEPTAEEGFDIKWSCVSLDSAQSRRFHVLIGRSCSRLTFAGGERVFPRDGALSGGASQSRA